MQYLFFRSYEEVLAVAFGVDWVSSQNLKNDERDFLLSISQALVKV